MHLLCSVNSVRFLHSLSYFLLTKSWTLVHRWKTEAQQRPSLSRASQPPHNKAEFKPRPLCIQRPCSFKGTTEVKAEELGTWGWLHPLSWLSLPEWPPRSLVFPPTPTLIPLQLRKHMCALGTSTQWASALESFLRVKTEETTVVKGKPQVEFCWLLQSTK